LDPATKLNLGAKIDRGCVWMQTVMICTGKRAGLRDVCRLSDNLITQGKLIFIAAAMATPTTPGQARR
jgi:hypothetical protein